MNIQNQPPQEPPRRIHAPPGDNVANVVNGLGLPAGTAFPDGLELTQFVPQGHKVALSDIADGGNVNEALLLVLGVDAAHTLVLQSTPGASLDLPLTVRIEQHDGGGTSVEFSDSSWLSECGEMPPDLVYQVNALPGLVDAALS